MKLVIQIPCLNEAATLPDVLDSIPTKIDGIDEIEVLIIDDGCTDETVAIAKQRGVKQFIHHRTNRGLAASFSNGVDRALELGADIVVNTDGDNQYPQADISRLVAPIIAGQADITIGDRQTSTIAHFSPAKKVLQRVGSQVVNWAAGTNIPDAVSGFRAYSRNSLLKLSVTNQFSYATETIIQAGHKGLQIVSLPITTNPKTRESRLFKSNWEHIRKSASAIIRAYLMYRPHAVFITLGSILLGAGLIPFVRYFYFFLQSSHQGHVQSLILGTVLFTGAFMSFVLAIVADLVRTNRILAEDSLERIKTMQYPPHDNRK